MIASRAQRGLFFFFAVLLFLALPSRANAQMSETERKSAARAAFTEGVTLQDAGKPAEALAKFETAQKLYDAPTHQLHIAECLSLTGKLVESGEMYEALVHRNLGANPPDAFTQAQEQAKAELPGVRARIPSMRVTVKPDPSTLQNLQVSVNGVVMPNELLGVARPVNPGPYRINAAANNYRLDKPVELTMPERDAKSDPKIVELTLQSGQAGAGVVVVPPPPPPYSGGQNPPPPEDKDKEKRDKDREGSSPTGILVGPRLGLLVPGGGITGGQQSLTAAGTSDVSFDSVAGVGGALGIDVMARFVKFLLIGGTLEFAGLSGPSELKKQLGTNITGETSQSTFYLGLNFGIVPNIDKVTFFGEVGAGLRTLSRSVTVGADKVNESFSGLEGELGAGVMIPAGKLRLLPKASLNIGSFSNVKSDCSGNGTITAGFANCFKDGSVSSTATHTIFFIGLGLYFHADLGQKK